MKIAFSRRLTSATSIWLSSPTARTCVLTSASPGITCEAAMSRYQGDSFFSECARNGLGCAQLIHQNADVFRIVHRNHDQVHAAPAECGLQAGGKTGS